MLNSTSTFFDNHKYNYSFLEQLGMVIITAISNFSFVPALILLIKRKNYFPSFMGLFTMITSFTYHFMESVALRKIFNMDEYQWHRLDNIGAICCFISLCIYMMDNRNSELDTILNFVGLLITLFCQESDPWNIWYTVIPILAFFGLIFAHSYRRGRFPKYPNRKMFKNGLISMFIGFFCFYFGLDEFQDYLRFAHGCWHFMVGVSSFYLWQVKTEQGEELNLENLTKKKLDPIHYDVKFL